MGGSTLMVLGGSSTYLGAADHVVAMRNDRPVHMTARALGLELAAAINRVRDLRVYSGIGQGE